MSERAGQLLRIACLLLAGWVIYEVAQMTPRINPLARVAIPALPALAPDTNNPTPISDASNNPGIAAAKGSNQPGELVGTNPAAANSTNAMGSKSSTSAMASTIKAQSTQGDSVQTNSAIAAIPAASGPLDSTNVANTNRITPMAATNLAGMVSNTQAEENSRTNLPAATNFTATNVATAQVIAITNASNVIAGLGNGTNGPVASATKGRSTNGATVVARASMPPNVRAAVPELPPDIKARVDRVYESEILGQVVHPLPMALIGIAGDFVFLRSANGQTGMIKEGESIGDLKLLRIGINRVLVEQGGKKQELMIFAGYGGTSLMPREKENSP